MSTQRNLVPLAIAMFLIVLSWVGLLNAQAHLTLRNLNVNGTPMQFMVDQSAESVPGVLVAHGYCGSKQLMLGYAMTLAHNGYGVLLWDLPGHGANTYPFDYASLQSSFEIPFNTLRAQAEVDASKLAVVGHSMGSGIAMEGAIANDDEIDAVVAISPTGAPVTPDTPKNLSLQLGEWESFLRENANRLLNEAGGTNLDLDQGKGRSLSTIQNAEHATILFKDQSHQEILDWLNRTFGLSQKSAFRDRRMAWYGIHLLGWLLCLGTVLPLWSKRPNRSQLNQSKPVATWRSLGGLIFAPLLSAGVLGLIGGYTPVENLGGLMLGGALGFWFFMIGTVWLAIIGQCPKLQGRDIAIGLIGFSCLWMGLGAMAQFVWLPWFLTVHRAILWGMIAIACFPWFIAFSLVLQTARVWQRLAWWLAHSAAVVGGLILAMTRVPNLGFLAIMLPAFPLLFGLFSYVDAKSQSVWGCTIACALTFSWLIVVPFPVL